MRLTLIHPTKTLDQKSVKRYHPNYFPFCDFAAFLFERNVAVGVGERGENARALCAITGDLVFAVDITQPCALIVGAPGTFSESAGRFDFQGKWRLANLAGHIFQDGQRELMQRDQRRNGIARQAKKASLSETAKSERFAGFDSDFPESNLAQLGENIFYKISIAHGYATAGNYRIGLLCSIDKSMANCIGLIGN